MSAIRRFVPVLVFALAAAACGSSDTATPTTTAAGDTTTTTAAETGGEEGIRVAKEGDTVSVHYTGTLDSGEEFDSSAGREPLTFVVGGGQLISGFDEAVRGLAVGEKRTVRIEPAEAYGEPRDDLILEFPIDQAPEGIAVGDTVSLGNGVPAVVIEVTDTAVTVDANHPLAGEALTFEIELVSIDS